MKDKDFERLIEGLTDDTAKAGVLKAHIETNGNVKQAAYGTDGYWVIRGLLIWIDMESGVRTDDAFDLVKARAVLEKCAPFVGGDS